MTNQTVSVQVRPAPAAPRGAFLIGSAAALVCRTLRAIPHYLAVYVAAHQESRHA